MRLLFICLHLYCICSAPMLADAEEFGLTVEPAFSQESGQRHPLDKVGFVDQNNIGRSSDNAWRAQIKATDIEARLPPWRSWWAYGSYLSFFTLLIYLMVRAKMKQLEFAQEKTLNSELVRLNRIKDTFLANTSHELRTPLSGIIGLAEGLRRYKGSDEEYEQRLSLIVSSSRRLSALVDDILDYSKMADCNLKLHRSHIPLRPLIGNVFSITEPLARDKNIALINAVTDGAEIVYADENRIQQILINLVSNGIKYSNGGHVKVSTQRNEAEFIIRIDDTGIGIKKEDISHIFVPFNQLKSAHHHRIGGTGLGLTVTKNLIELHGGSIEVSSERGRGSSFIVRLPVEVRAPVQTAATANNCGCTEQPAEEQTSKTIVIADDDPVNRMILSEVLRTNHYKVIEAIDGQRAIDACLSNANVHLAILDIMMPHIDGYEVCRKLRQISGLEKLPVLFLTANVTAIEQEMCCLVAAQDVLIKPVPNEQLLHRVRAIIGQPDQRQ